MQYKWTIIITALVIAFLPFLGFPGAARDSFIAIGGLGIAVVVFFSNEISRLRWKGKKSVDIPDSYVENEKADDVDSFPPKV